MDNHAIEVWLKILAQNQLKKVVEELGNKYFTGESAGVKGWKKNFAIPSEDWQSLLEEIQGNGGD